MSRMSYGRVHHGVHHPAFGLVHLVQLRTCNSLIFRASRLA